MKNISEGSPHDYRSRSNERKKKSEGGPTVYWSLSIDPFRELKPKSFVLENDFHTWQKKKKCMCEGVSEDLRHGMGL